MATSPDDIKKTYPIPVYYFEVKIDDLDPIAFSEVSGLSIDYETITYKDGLSYKEGVKYMPGQASPINLSLKKGIVKGGAKLYNWLSSIKLNTVEKKDITISLKDEEDAPVVTWKVIDAFPKKMDAPGFNATSSEIAIESMDLMANDLKIEFH